MLGRTNLYLSCLLVAVYIVVGALSKVSLPSNHNSAQTDEQKRTFFILFAHDITNVSSFPKTACAGFDCALYDSFVVQPENINSTHIQLLRGLRKDGEVKIFAYFDTLHIPIISGCAHGHSMGDANGKTCEEYQQCTTDGAYLTGLRKAFPPSFGIRNLSASSSADGAETICTYPALASYVLYQDSVEALGKYLVNEVVLPNGFDGVYMDNRISPAVFQEEEAYKIFSEPGGSNLDANGDGKADTAYEVLAQYTAFAPAFSMELRRMLGPNATIIGNSAGSLSDPALNGVTIEMEACTDLEACTDAVVGQNMVAARPSFGVFWLTHSESMPPAKQCSQVKQMQSMFPWMHAGTDFFDLSHIVCNDSRKF